MKCIVRDKFKKYCGITYQVNSDSITTFRIEKSREVIPTFLEAARSKQKHQDLNIDQLYKLLFTRENLKLVQIGCHKKAARESGKVKWTDFCTN